MGVPVILNDLTTQLNNALARLINLTVFDDGPSGP